MDAFSQELNLKAEKATTQFFSKSLTKAERKKLVAEANDLFTQSINNSQKKISLIQSAYDQVDQHIQKLDKDLNSFDIDMASGKFDSVRGSKNQKKPRTHSNEHKQSREPEKKLPGIETMPVDPDESRYCYCGQVSFGEMIACDNDFCDLEWFHYDCVGLSSPPKGKWYCRECLTLRKKGLLKTQEDNKQP